MKITGFNPSVLTSKPDDLIHLFEDLGFEKSHVDPAAEGIASGSTRMKYADFRLDITATDRFPQDKNLIRMNVDDIDECSEFLTARGFRITNNNEKPYETEYAKSAQFVSPSGYTVIVVEHKKN